MPGQTQSAQKLSTSEMAAKIRALAPGAYDDKADDILVSAYLKKNPQYAPMVNTSTIQTAPSSNPDLSSALDSMSRMYTGQRMATPNQEAQFQQGRATGQIAGTAQAATGFLGPLSAPSVTTSSAGTGILDATGAEIMKDITTYGPSAARLVLSHPLAQKLLFYAAGTAGAGGILKALGLFDKGK